MHLATSAVRLENLYNSRPSHEEDRNRSYIVLLDHMVHLQNLAYEYVDVTGILYDIYIYIHVISYKIVSTCVYVHVIRCRII